VKLDMLRSMTIRNEGVIPSFLLARYLAKYPSPRQGRLMEKMRQARESESGTVEPLMVIPLKGRRKL